MNINFSGITFPTWDNVQKEFFTSEEIAESKVRVASIKNDFEILSEIEEEGYDKD